MNKAFVKDDDGASDALPDREISPHPNLVTANGMAEIEKMVEHLEGERRAALAADDRGTLVNVERHLRYWTARRSSAQRVARAQHSDHVIFGSAVTIGRTDGREQTFKIVGEDEADPSQGTISYVSPLAQAMLGSVVGDTIIVAGNEAEVLAIGI